MEYPSIQDEIDELKKSLKTSNSDIANFESMVNKLNAYIDYLEGENRDLKSENYDSAAHVKELSDEIRGYEKQIADLENELNKAQF